MTEDIKMSKPAALFVSAAMAATAGCVSVIAGRGLGLGLSESLLAGVGALAAMAAIHLAVLRAGAREDSRVDEIDSLVSDLQSRLETAEARLAVLDGATAERARAATRPLVDEIAALGGLVTTIANEVANHDVSIARLKSDSALKRGESASRFAPAPVAGAAAALLAARAERPASPPASVSETAGVRLEPAAAPFDLDVIEPAAKGPAVPSGARDRFARALGEGRIESYLQPIVALPSRRTTHYEALSRIIERDGVLPAADFMETARDRLPDLDSAAVERVSLVAMRLAARDEGAVFVNLAPETLRDAAARQSIAAAFEARQDVRRLVVIEMRQAAFAALGEPERQALDALVEQGVRLSLDDVTDLRIDGHALSERGVRFVKTQAARLLDPEAARGAAIHPADLAGLLARHGIDLIATHVEHERTVPELLDMEVRLAQGFLFGVPRPVRPAGSAPERAAPAAAAARLVPRAAASR